MLTILASQRAYGGHRKSELIYAVAAVCCCRRMTLDRQDAVLAFQDVAQHRLAVDS
jgi:hypothetical protein